jgi:hypothetical protein
MMILLVIKIVAYHSRHSEFTRMHLLRQPINLSAGIAENDGLRDGDGLVKITEGIEFPFFLFNGNIELLNTFESQLVPLDEDTDGVAHELLGHLKHLCGHGGREEDDLDILRKELEDLVDLVLETTRKHFVSLVKTEDLDVVGTKRAAVDHVINTARGTHDDLDALLELGHIFPDVGSANTSMALNIHVITKGDHDFLDLLSKLTRRGEYQSLGTLNGHIELLKDGDGECGGLSSTGLGLGNDIVTFHDGDDGTLLDGRRTLETEISGLRIVCKGE